MSVVASLSDVAKLVAAVAWPLVVLFAILWLRRPLVPIFERVARNLKTLSIGSVSIELGEDASTSSQGLDAIADLSIGSELPQSNKPTLAKELAKADPLPYTVIDLGRGKRWLSSRLYLFVVLLRRTRGLGTVIFIETREDVAGRFVGLARAEALERALETANPWLAIQMAGAYSQVFTPYVAEGIGGEQVGWLYEQVANDFVTRIQTDSPPAHAAGTVQMVPDGWVLLGGTPNAPRIEHASWLTGPELNRLVGDAIDPFACIVEDEPLSTAARARKVLGLAHRDDIVVVDRDRTFKRTLVKRREALENLAAQAIEASDPR
jgi:hypothetical protein